MAELIEIALILLFGTLCAALAYRLKVSNMFFLVLAGMLFGILNVVDFSGETIIIIAQLTLILVLFDSTSKLNFKEIARYYKESLTLSGVFFVICMLVMAASLFFLFELNPSVTISILVALLFATLMFDTDPATIMSSIRGKNRIIEIMEIESIVNTPLTVVLSLMLLGIINKTASQTMTVSSHVIGFLQQIFIPIGVGAAAGFIIVHILKNHYFEELSHLATISSAVTVYALSEMLNGNGVLGVTTFGLIFGNYYVNHKLEVEKFASIFAYTLKILVFVLLGVVIVQYGEYRTVREFMLGSLLFLVFLLIRFLSVSIALKKTTFRERLFMTLNIPKGIDVAVIILIMVSSISAVEGLAVVRNISLLFILYSIVISTVSSMFHEWYFERESVSNLRIKKTKHTSK